MRKSHNVYKWATSWQNLFFPQVKNKSTHQPVYPCSLISAFVIRCTASIIAISKISRLKLVCVAEQAGLSLTWSGNPEDRFSSDVAQKYFSALTYAEWANKLCTLVPSQEPVYHMT